MSRNGRFHKNMSPWPLQMSDRYAYKLIHPYSEIDLVKQRT